MGKSINAIAYVRSNDVLLANKQLMSIIKYCQRHGYKLAKYFIETSDNGLEKIYELQDMVECNKKGTFNVVVVSDVSRLTKEPFLLAAHIWYFKKKGMRLESTSEKIKENPYIDIFEETVEELYKKDS